MGKRFKINGDLNNPIVSNTILCIGTYIIVILYTTIACMIDTPGTQSSQVDNISQVVKCFADALIPTTITFVLGIVMQNFVTAVNGKIASCTYTILVLFLCVAYAGIYIWIRTATWCTSVLLTLGGSYGMIYLAMTSVLQLQEHQEVKLKKNLISG